MTSCSEGYMENLPKYSRTDLISEMGVLLRRSMSSFGAIANRICRARTRDRLLAVEEVRCGRGSYCNLPRKHPYPCKCPPPILMILWFTYIVYIYTIYIQMDSPCKRPPPVLAHEFQVPMGAYLGEYGTCKSLHHE